MVGFTKKWFFTVVSLCLSACSCSPSTGDREHFDAQNGGDNALEIDMGDIDNWSVCRCFRFSGKSLIFLVALKSVGLSDVERDSSCVEISMFSS